MTSPAPQSNNSSNNNTHSKNQNNNNNNKNNNINKSNNKTKSKSNNNKDTSGIPSKTVSKKKKRRKQNPNNEGGGLNDGRAVFFLMCAMAMAVAGLSIYFPDMSKEIVVGMDLGTTFSVVAVCVGGKVEVLPFTDGKVLLPSYVRFDERGRPTVGSQAKLEAATHSTSTVYDAKRLIGRTYDDPEVMMEKDNLPFTIVASSDDPPLPLVSIPSSRGRGDQHLYAANVSAMVVKEMKDTVESFYGIKKLLGWTLKKATISIPANFNIAQQLATLEAGKQAGLKVVQLITEPAAAALAYQLQKKPGLGYVMVFDFGGGTLDVALLVLEHDVFNVVATAGDPHLGGEDVDRNTLTHLTKLFREQSGVDLSDGGDVRAMEQLRRKTEDIKIALSSKDSVDISIANLSGGKGLEATLTKEKFEEVNKALFDRCLLPIHDLLKRSSAEKSEISDVVLVGGSSRIPRVRDMIAEHFPGIDISFKINPDEAVARGAALTRMCK